MILLNLTFSEQSLLHDVVSVLPVGLFLRSPSCYPAVEIAFEGAFVGSRRHLSPARTPWLAFGASLWPYWKIRFVWMEED